MKGAVVEPGRGKLPRRIVAVGILFASVLILVTAKVAIQAERHLAQAHAALEENDLEKAVWHYQWAVRYHVPFLPANRRAVEGLQNLETRAESDEQRRRVLLTLRSSLYAIRSVYQPFPDVLNKVEEELNHVGFVQSTAE